MDGNSKNRQAGELIVSPPVGFYLCFALPLGLSLSFLFLFLFPVLHAAYPIRQAHKALGKMNILHHNIVRNIQIQMGKVPDSFNSRIDQTVSSGAFVFGMVSAAI